MPRGKRLLSSASICGLILLFRLAPAAYSANVVVPSLELISHGYIDSGTLVLETRSEMQIAFEGGYKFGGRLGFSYASDALEKDAVSGIPQTLQFDGASISIRDIFSIPLSISYFVGQDDLLCAGDSFTTQFGTAPIMTNYRGFMYFPKGILYDGIHSVKGTGAKIELLPIPETLLLSLYAYEDTHFSTLGNYSADLRVLANFGAAKLEGFFGATYSPPVPLGYYRGGLLMYWSNKNLEFLAQVGVPRFDPTRDSPTDLDLLYLLFEPRVHLGILSIVPTFFLHPVVYLQQENLGETGSIDVNLNIYLGDAEKSTFRGGIEGNVVFQSSDSTFEFKLSPYFGFATPGVLWTLKANAKLWPFSLDNMFDGFVGIRAEF